MTERALDRRAAGLILRTMLGRDLSAEDIERVGWDRVAKLAATNGVLLRFAARLDPRILIPASVKLAVDAEGRRAAAALRIVGRVSEICTREQVPFLFPKALQHLPDVGTDLDLLVGERFDAIDAVLARELGGVPVAPSLGSRIAGTSTYLLPDGPPLDIQHGRLGAVGEHSAFPTLLLTRSRRRVIDGMELLVPSPEDQLVLQGLQRVYGKRRIRLSDIAYTVTTIRRDALDWDYITAQARRAGVADGLGCYLSYVDQVHRELMSESLLEEHVRRRMPLSGWGRLDFRGGYFRYPTLRVGARVYPAMMAAHLRRGNWSGAGRLCLVPVLGMASAIRTRRATPATGAA